MNCVYGILKLINIQDKNIHTINDSSLDKVRVNVTWDDKDILKFINILHLTP